MLTDLAAYILPVLPLETYKDSDETGISGGLPKYLAGTAAVAYTKSGRLEKALEIVDQIEDDDSNWSYLSQIIKECINLGQFEQISGILGRIIDKVELYYFLQNTVYDNLKHPQQSRILREIIKVNKCLEEREYKLKSLKTVVENTQDPGVLEEALEAMKELPRNSEVETEISETEALIKDVKLVQSETDLSKILENTKKVNNQNFKAEVLLGIINCAQTPDILEKVLETAKEMSSEYNRSGVLTEVAILYFNLGNLEKALKIADEANDGPKIGTRFKILSALVKYTQDFEILTKIEEKVAEYEIDSVYILEDIAEVYAKAGKVEKTLEIVDKIDYEADNKLYGHSLGSVRSDKFCRSSFLIKIAQEFPNPVFLAKALGIANEIIDSYEQTQVLTNIAEEYAKIGNLEEAFAILNRLGKLDDRRSSVCNSIARGLAKAGNLDQALEIDPSIRYGTVEKLAQDWQPEINILEYFQEKVQPLLANYSLFYQIEGIDAFIRYLPREFFTALPDLVDSNSLSKEETRKNPNLKSEAKERSFEEKLEDLTNQNLYLLPEDKNVFYNQLLAILNIPIQIPTQQEVTDSSILKDVYESLVQKLTREDSIGEKLSLEQVAKLMQVLITKDPNKALKYLEKYLWYILGGETMEKAQAQKQLQFFLSLAADYNILEYKWKFVIKNEKYLTAVHEMLKNRSKDAAWDLKKLDSLVATLHKNDFLSDLTKEPELIKLYLENNLVSPELYKILRQTPEDKRQEILPKNKKSLKQLLRNHGVV